MILFLNVCRYSFDIVQFLRMRTILEINKYRLLTICLLLLSLLIAILVGNQIVQLKFFTLIPLGVLLGIGFTGYLKKIFPIKNIITFLTLSLFNGLWINTLIVFLLGVVGVSINAPLFMLYIPVSFLLNMFLFFYCVKEETFKEYLSKTKLEVIDIVWMGIFSLFFIMLANACMELFTPAWDSFTFWALDSKYIFEHEKLRDGSFLLLANNYLSFYTIQINYVYLLYGKIVEQSASLLSLIYTFIGITLVSSYVIDIKRSAVKKSLLYLSLVAAIYTSFVVHYVLISLYADLFLSVVLLIFVLVLFLKKPSIENYWKRVIVLLFLALTLYLTKTHYLVMGIFLFFSFLVYDFKFIIDNRRQLLKKPLILLSLGVTVLFLLVIRKYALSLTNEGAFVEGVARQIKIDGYIFVGLKEVIKQLLSRAPLFSLTLFMYLVLSLFIKKGLDKYDIRKMIFLFILIAMPVSMYVLKILNIVDLSMLRYIGLSFFVIPILFLDSLPESEIDVKWQKFLVVFVITVVPFLVLFQIAKETSFDFNFLPHGGSYKDFTYKYKEIDMDKHFNPMIEFSDISQKVLEIIPGDATIMVLDLVNSNDQNQIANTFLSGLYLRYYLSNNNLGGPYACSPENCFEFFHNMQPDYILIYTYDIYWEECNEILGFEKSYLVKFDKSGKLHEEGKCIVSPENIVTTF